jgi:hypothetical protein
MLRRAEGSLGGNHAGELHRQAADAKAERIIAEELQRNGWCERDFLARRKKDPAKLSASERTDLRFAEREQDQIFECDAGREEAGRFLRQPASFEVFG